MDNRIAKKQLPPHDIRLEKAVLAALMIDSTAAAKAIDLIHCKEIFFDKKHQIIFKAINDLFVGSQSIDILTVAQKIRKNGDKVEVAYIAEISSSVVGSQNIVTHIHILLEKYMQRSIITIGEEISQTGYDDTLDVFELLEKAEGGLTKLLMDVKKSDTKTIQGLSQEVLSNMESISKRNGEYIGIGSGYTDLDRLTCGWQDTDLIILAARPSMGKTAFMLNLARNAAVEGKKSILVFSLEMGAQQLVQRMICCESNIDLQSARMGTIESYQWIEIQNKMANLYNCEINIDDTPNLTINNMRAKAKRYKSMDKVDLIIIDYLQLMNGEKGLPREQQIASITRNLKYMAKELGVPVIALSQLSRNVLNRGSDKRPTLGDLRESGAIEQDADVVMFLHRPEYFGMDTLENGESSKGVCELIIGKQRNGPTDTVLLDFNSRTGKFSNRNNYTYTNSYEVPNRDDEPNETMPF